MIFYIKDKTYRLDEVEQLDSQIAVLALALYRTAQQFPFLRHHLKSISMNDVDWDQRPPHIEARYSFDIEGRRYHSQQDIMWHDLEPGRVGIERIAYEMCYRTVTKED